MVVGLELTGEFSSTASVGVVEGGEEVALGREGSCVRGGGKGKSHVILCSVEVGGVLQERWRLGGADGLRTAWSKGERRPYLIKTSHVKFRQAA